MSAGAMQKPYHTARWLFGIANASSWTLIDLAKDRELRRDVWVVALVASIGGLVAFEMQRRATRSSGGLQ